MTWQNELKMFKCKYWINEKYNKKCKEMSLEKKFRVQNDIQKYLFINILKSYVFIEYFLW